MHKTVHSWQLLQDEKAAFFCNLWHGWKTVSVHQKSNPFFIYYFYPVIYKTSQQHKYPTWKTHCILFKIVVLLRSGHISWTLKTQFAGQRSLVLVGRFIPVNAYLLSASSAQWQSIFARNFHWNAALWDFWLTSLGFAKLYYHEWCKKAAPECEILRGFPKSLSARCLPTSWKQAREHFFCGGKGTECFQRHIIICPLWVHWRILFVE